MAVFYLSHPKESGFSDRREFVQVYVLIEHRFFKALLVFFSVFTLKKGEDRSVSKLWHVRDRVIA